MGGVGGAVVKRLGKTAWRRIESRRLGRKGFAPTKEGCRLPLFTESPRRGVPGNWLPALGSSRKLKRAEGFKRASRLSESHPSQERARAFDTRCQRVYIVNLENT